MAYDSDPSFRVLHALRIKGFAKVDVLSDLSAVEPDEVEQHLADFQAGEIALFREARSLWQLTPKGREVHAEQLASEAEAIRPLVEPHYPAFLELNEAFKELCGDWQLRDGAPNDHTDAALRRGGDRPPPRDRQPGPAGRDRRRHRGDAPVALRAAAGRAPRNGWPGGDTSCSPASCAARYHDVWMELHEDLILTLGIDRAEGGVVLMPARFGRVLTAMVTPFDAEGGLDLDGAGTLARWLQDHGNDGLVVAGTTGEAPVLTDDEKLSLWAAVAEAVTIPVIAGTGTNDTAHSVHLTGEAAGARRGRHPRRRARTTTARRRPGIEAHLRAIAAATDLPVDGLRHPDPHRAQDRARRCCCAWPARCPTCSPSRTPPATRGRPPA